MATTSKKTETTTDVTANEPTYTKDQILKSKKYAHRRDLLGVLLSDKQEYKIAEIDKAIDNYMNGGKK